MKDFEIIDWDSLTFANNYVFLEVMNNKRRCQYLIEKVLHIPIKKILQIVAERHTSSPRISSKSIRLDVYVEVLDGTVIDLEMQVTGKGSTIYRDKDEEKVERSLPLRTRYYQSLISMDMLRRNDTDWRERVVTWEMDLRILKKEAREEGKQEGKREGMALAKQEIAEALRKKGMSEAEIAEVTGLPEKKKTRK